MNQRPKYAPSIGTVRPPVNAHGATRAQAKLAKAEGRSPDGVMSAKMDGPNLVVGPAERPAEVEAMLAGATLEEKAEELGYSEDMSEPELDARTKALRDLITHKMAWERRQIVGVIVGYADDCAQRAIELEGKSDSRAAAFRVRAAVCQDIATKIGTGWGRKADGTPQ